MKVRFLTFALCSAIGAVVLSEYGWCDSAADKVIAQIVDGNTAAAIASLRDVRDIEAAQRLENCSGKLHIQRQVLPLRR